MLASYNAHMDTILSVTHASFIPNFQMTLTISSSRKKHTCLFGKTLGNATNAPQLLFLVLFDAFLCENGLQRLLEVY